MKKIKVYTAGGWFNPQQAEALKNMQDVLKEFDDIEIFSPKDEVLCPPDADFETRQKVFDIDVREIGHCDLVVASTAGKDMGTLFECGYAYALRTPVIYYAELPKGASFNLMLASSGVAVATNKDELREIISHFKRCSWNFYANKINYNGPIE